MGGELASNMTKLDYKQSLETVRNAERLNPLQRYLSELLLSQGRSYLVHFDGNPEPVPILDVTRFLNHRVDGELMRHIGRTTRDTLRRFNPDVLLTAATSGIAPAIAQATQSDNGAISILYARKGEPPLTMDKAGVYRVDSRSYTGRGRPVALHIARDCLQRGETYVVSDEFLDYGVTTQGLIELGNQAGTQLRGCLFVIEKQFSGGRSSLRQHTGLTDDQIVSLLVIEAQGEGWMKIQGVDQILTFQRTNEHSQI